MLSASESYHILPLENPLLSAKSAFESLATAIKILGEYIFLLLYPRNLLYDRSFGQITIVGFSNIFAVLSLLVLISSIIFSLIKLRKKDLIAYGILFFLITISLFSNIFFKIGAAMAERFLYFASFGFAFILGTLIVRLTKTNQGVETFNTVSDFFNKNKRALLILMPICFIYSIKTISRNKDWKDNFSLFSADIGKMPNNARAHSFLGNELMRTIVPLEPDSVLRAQIYVNGIDELKKSISIYPKHSDALAAIGSGYLAINSLDSAELYYKKAVALDPNLINNLGDVYFKKKDYDKALLVYKKKLKMSPNSPLVLIKLGITYGTLKKYDLALKYLLKADQLQPNDAQINLFIATAYQFKGDLANYKNYYQKSIDLSN